MSQVRPSAAHRRAAPTRIGRQAPAAIARANTAPSSATRRVPARSRGRQYCRRHAKSCEPATPTVVRSNGLAPALPALHGAQAKQSPDRRPPRASRLPISASDPSCHGAADSTPVLLSESSLAQTTFVPSRKAESQLPLGGTRRSSVTGPCLAVVWTRPERRPNPGGSFSDRRWGVEGDTDQKRQDPKGPTAAASVTIAQIKHASNGNYNC